MSTPKTDGTQPPLADAAGSAHPSGELRVLEYELGQITVELAKICGHVDNIQKRLGQAISPNAKVSSGDEPR
jgi:hypothetical protein